MQNCCNLKELFLSADSFPGTDAKETPFIQVACDQLKSLALGPALTVQEIRRIFNGICINPHHSLMKFYFQPSKKKISQLKLPFIGSNEKQIQLMNTKPYMKKSMDICNVISIEGYSSVVFHRIKKLGKAQCKHDEIILCSSDIKFTRKRKKHSTNSRFKGKKKNNNCARL